MTKGRMNVNRRRFLAGTGASAVISPLMVEKVAADEESYGHCQYVRARYGTEIIDEAPSDYLTGQSHDFPGHHFAPGRGKLYLNKFIRENGKENFRNNEKIVKMDRYFSYPSQKAQPRPRSFFTTKLGDGLLSSQIVFTSEPYRPPGVNIQEQNEDIIILHSGNQVRLSPGERKKLPLPERHVNAIKNTDPNEYESIRIRPHIIIQNYGIWEVIDSNKANYWCRTRINN